jgi:hypothetical protein
MVSSMRREGTTGQRNRGKRNCGTYVRIEKNCSPKVFILASCRPWLIARTFRQNQVGVITIFSAPIGRGAKGGESQPIYFLHGTSKQDPMQRG